MLMHLPRHRSYCYEMSRTSTACFSGGATAFIFGRYTLLPVKFNHTFGDKLLGIIVQQSAVWGILLFEASKEHTAPQQHCMLLLRRCTS